MKDKNDIGKCIDIQDRSIKAEKRKREKEEFDRRLEELKTQTEVYDNEENTMIQELFESFLVDVEKGFKRDCKRKINWSLEQMMSYLKKNEIKAKLTSLSVKYLQKDKKSELVNRYMQNYENAYKNLFEYITKELYSDLMKLKIQKYNIDLDYIRNLNNSSLLDILGIATIGVDEDDELRFFIPKEIAKIIEEFPFDKKTMKRNKEIIEVSKGLIRAYGAIDIETILENLIDYKIITTEDDEEKIDAIIQMNLSGEESLICIDGYYVDSTIAFEEELEVIINVDAEFKKFSKEEVLQIESVREEIRKAKFISIRNFLRQFNIGEEEIDAEIIEMYAIYQLSIDAEEDICEHIDETYDMPDEMRADYARDVLKVFYTMPKWKLKGFSRNEIDEENYRLMNEAKKNRSKTCTCGSGKEFKECCGKNIIEVDFTTLK